MKTSQPKHRTEGVEPFEAGGARFYLKRHGLTGVHRSAWKQSSRLHKAMHERTGQTLQRLAQLDGLLSTGALQSQTYEAARDKIDDKTVTKLSQFEGALDALLDLHLVGWENPLDPREPMPPCDARTRRALPIMCKLDLTDEVRRRLIVDYGPERAARDFGLWGEDLKTVQR